MTLNQHVDGVERRPEALCENFLVTPVEVLGVGGTDDLLQGMNDKRAVAGIGVTLDASFA